MEERTFVVVPAFNEERAIGSVVRELGAMGATIVVIDDGSFDATAEVARAAGAIVLRHAVNRGQGAALQTGITYATRRGAAYVVTFDSDGQHRPEDVETLLAPLRAGRAEVVLGSRFLGTTEQMPAMRRLILRGAVMFTRIVTGLRLTDTHNGLRAFTRPAASKINIRLDRMAHASEILDQIVTNAIPFVEVPVHIRYTAYSRAKGQTSMNVLRILFDYLVGRWLR